MKVNVFKISQDKIGLLLDKFEDKKVCLSLTKKEIINGWDCSFYLSKDPSVKNIKWLKDYKKLLNDENIENIIHFSAYVCIKDENIFVLTNGKSHFYVRNFCERNFGLEMAKRIANKDDVRQIAVQRIAGKKRKEIKSYSRNSRLDHESGESVDYISANIVDDEQAIFGKSSKFGDSLIVARADLDLNNLTELFDNIISTLKKEEKFSIPKTIEILDKENIEIYDNLLLKDIISLNPLCDFVVNSYDIIGTDFIFSGNEKYLYHYNKIISREFDTLEICDFKEFINLNNISQSEIFNINIEFKCEDKKPYLRKVKELVEYWIEDENIVLQNGKWIKLNDEYIQEINESVDSIRVEATEENLEEIKSDEPHFNYINESSDKKEKGWTINNELLKYNYSSADKDFSVIKIKGNYKAEAWDLIKGDTVYAVKFGSSQDLVYVCNQAFNTLEIIRNNANLQKLTNRPKRYCLWFVFNNKKVPKTISEINSIILKQQVDVFARKCREINIEPVLKFSKRIK